MTTVITTATTTRVSPAGWSRPSAAAASLAGAPVYQLAVPTTAFAQDTQKRDGMDRTHIDGWPLGPQDGESG